ncbi:gluconate 2-dehydrogenase subunit 3 family protein [Membranicola marinus]|uniref:Gluconate 2-dehydrogenase subunit 3 family protein n=1 Tax=Membranihabitans marinus TaxID=1227546 RepID=A0A953HRT8_9BACT|nr:gluconate 2-dehydrogenase subunit 3 family protein [Membranihabitans marinus]MBY5957200.1 gluconate 2-dehydrogenase subunit 3 family protein [Membranihabitans marinus]
MDRRRSLRYLVAGTAATGLVFTGCSTSDDKNGRVEGVPKKEDNPFNIGRTPEELERDKALTESNFFTTEEVALINVLADIIIPADGQFKAASETGVAEFIDFMALDKTGYQVPLRGGLQWVNHESRKRFNKEFVDASDKEQIEIVDDIAYPYDADPAYAAGVRFFSTMRNLVVCGYYSSKEGMADLGYMGNTPNVWDGVPQEVLDKHGLAYDQKTLDECIDQSTRNEVMDWSGYEL